MAVRIGGSHPSNRAEVDSTGNLYTTLGSALSSSTDSISTEGHDPTYSAAFTITPANGATDVVGLASDGTVVIHLRRLRATGFATAANYLTCLLMKRTTLDTGGTPSTITPVANNPANQGLNHAILVKYTTTPTGLGTAAGVGSARGQVQVVPASGTPPSTGVPPVLDITCTNLNDEAFMVASPTAQLALNLNTLAFSGLTLLVEIEWTESAT